MPLIVGSAAHLVICQKCREHGKIVLADGRKSKAFYSKEAALNTLEEALTLELLEKDEVPELERQIVESPLRPFIQPLDIATALFDAFADDEGADSDDAFDETDEPFDETDEPPTTSRH